MNRPRRQLAAYLGVALVSAFSLGYSYDQNKTGRDNIRNGVANSFADSCERGNVLRADVRLTLAELLPEGPAQDRVLERFQDKNCKNIKLTVKEATKP